MEEKLAIRTVHLDAWEKARGKDTATSGPKSDLKPPKGEPEKSSFAHVLEDSIDIGEMLACRPDACRELQALALYIFKEEEDSAKNVKHRIDIVSIYRAAFDPDDVIEDAVDHPINDYQATHRSLKTRDPEKRQVCANKIVREGLFECHWYDRTQLRVTLRFLIDNKAIQENFLPAAQRLLKRWTQSTAQDSR